MQTANSVDDVEIREAMKSVQGTWKVWLLVFLAGGLGGYGIYHLRNELDVMKAGMTDADARASKKQAELLAAKDARAQLEARIDDLEKTNAGMTALLQKAEAESRDEELMRAKLTSLSGTIALSLESDVKSRDVILSVRDQGLVVDIADRLLFEGPEPIVSKRGEELLAKLGPVIATFPGAHFEVRGHTEGSSVPDKIKATIPSAWELSALHAAAVARKLIEGAKLKEESVLVSGHGAGMPRDKSAKAKARNRRVEVVVATIRNTAQ
jgi:chemotaxis protein MotB